eukprot:g42232.t1
MRHRAHDVVLDEEEEEDEEKRLSDISGQVSVMIEGVEYKIERLDGRSQESPSAGYVAYFNRNSKIWNQIAANLACVPVIRLKQQLSKVLNEVPAAYPEPAAPIRTAKAERRYQERLRMQSPDLPVGQDKELSPAERRALEAEKRAMWRAARHQALEDDLRQYKQEQARRLYQSRQRAAEVLSLGQGSRVKPLPVVRQEGLCTEFRWKETDHPYLLCPTCDIIAEIANRNEEKGTHPHSIYPVKPLKNPVRFNEKHIPVLLNS